MKAAKETAVLFRAWPRLAALGAAAAVLLAGCGTAEPAPREVPAPPVTSVAQADQQLAAVEHERAAIEARYAERVRECYGKFFVNNCLDDAKERRRSALAAQRAIEVQAARFKRQAIVDQRDREMAAAEKRFQEEEARLAAEPPKAPPQAQPEQPPRKPQAGERIARRDARLKADARQDAADAARRAQNVRDFEARKAESAERQRRVAERKAEKAAKAAKQAATQAEEAKAKAAQDAARAQGQSGR